MGNAHHIANCYHKPLVLSVSPHAEHAGTKHRTTTDEIGGRVGVEAGYAGVGLALDIHKNKNTETVEKNIKSHHDDNMVVVHPGRVIKFGSGKGDFIKIKEEGKGGQFLSKGYKLQPRSGIIITPNGHIANAEQGKMLVSSTGTNYGEVAAYFRTRSKTEADKMISDLEHENLTEYSTEVASFYQKDDEDNLGLDDLLPIYKPGSLIEERELGRGGYGIVTLVHLKGDPDEKLAVKKLTSLSKQQKMLLKKEVGILFKMAHENIIKICGLTDNVDIVMEYMNFNLSTLGLKGAVNNLADFLRNLHEQNAVKKIVREKDIFPAMARQIISGIEYMHKKQYAHQDIKPHNILLRNLNNSVICKITDFGEAKAGHMVELPESGKLRSGTMAFQSPEQVLGTLTSAGIRDLQRIDIWALGMVVFCIMNPSIEWPYHRELMNNRSKNLGSIMEESMKKRKLPEPDPEYHYLSEEYPFISDIKQQCLEFKPEKRIIAANISDVIKHEMTSNMSTVPPGNISDQQISSVLDQSCTKPFITIDYGGKESASAKLKSIYGLTYLHSGNLAAAEKDGNRVIVYNAEGWMGTSIQMGAPRDVAATSDGCMLAVNYTRIYKFHENGKELFCIQREELIKFDIDGFEKGYIKGVCEDKNGIIYVRFEDSVFVLNSSGKVLRHLHGNVPNARETYFCGIAVRPEGDILLPDYHNGCIVVLSATGEKKSIIGGPSRGEGGLVKPRGIATDDEGNIAVTCNGKHRVLTYSPSGRFIRKWGWKGDSNGQFSYPSGVSVSASGRVAVGENGNKRIQVF